MISGTGGVATAEVLDVSSPLIPEESSLHLIDGFSFAGVSSSAPPVTLADDLRYVNSWN